MFTLSGGHVFPLYDAVVKDGADPPLRLVDVRHEQTAVFAAEATARLTRTPGLAVVTAGPGVTNSVSAVTTAWFNGAPVVVLAGRAPDYRWGAGSLQEMDHPPLLAPVTKRAWTEHDTARLAGSVDEAFRLATSPHRGPVFLDVSLEALYGQAEANLPAGGPPAADTGGADVDRIAELLRAARRPVLVLGSDVWLGGAEDAARRAAEELRLPVIANGQARGVLPRGHELLVTRARSAALRQADLVIVAGTPLDFRLGYGSFGPKDAPALVVHVADAPGGIATHVPLAASAVGDLAAFFTALTGAGPAAGTAAGTGAGTGAGNGARAGARAEAADVVGTRVAAYRSGYLPEDRRRLEAALSDGSLVGLATTTALELGVNITGLDAVLIAGWPGTFSALWQQAGRAGRSGRAAAAVLIARDDPLDTYLVRHPEMLLRHPVEATVLDPDNPYVLGPHLCAAAAEMALTEQDLDLFGPTARTVVDDLTRAGRLRRRPAGWYSMRRNAAAALGLRGAGLAPVRVVEQATGRLVGTVDEPSAYLIVHEGAVYVHQGDSYLVGTLDLADRVALVEPGDPGYTTTAKTATEVEVRGEQRAMTWGAAEIRFGDVQVTRQVVSFVKRSTDTGASLGETPLDLPPRHLLTRAVWWTVSEEAAGALAAAGVDLGGAAHAAEHASIGLLPLFATCDRWDIGGVSAARHPATGKLTVFVYDGHDGGAGFAERGFGAAADWLRATRQAIASCDCEAGCPSCVQSPKCGNANHPLSKAGAVALLDTVLADTGLADARPADAG